MLNQQQLDIAPYDMAYVINLDRSPQRWQAVSDQLIDSGIIHQRFSATNGNEILIESLKTNEKIYGIDLKNKSMTMGDDLKYQISCNPNDSNPTQFNYLGRLLTAGEFGIWCSNLRVWQDAIANNYQNIIIFEDDIIIKTDIFAQQLNNFITHLPKSFDLAYIDASPLFGQKLSLPNNSYVHSFDDEFLSWGAYALLFSNQGMQKLLALNSYTGATDLFFWLASKNRNLDHLDDPIISPLLLEAYGSSQDLVGVILENSEIVAMGRI